MRIKKSLIMIIVLTLAVTGGWMFMSRKSKGTGENERVINPRYGNIRNVITTTATILPKNRLEIKPTVNGRVEKVLVQEGQMVKAGDILAWMSSTDRAALLDAARGQGEKERAYWEDVYKPIPLLAPIDGQVIVATTQPGQTVTPADPIVVLSDRLIVRAQVDETDIGKIKADQEVEISLDAYAGSEIAGKVDHLYYESKTVNNVTIYEVDLLPIEIPAYFRSGMNASVDFIIEDRENILLVPLVAVTKNEDGAFVWLKGEKKNIKQKVETGLSDDKNIEIKSGLSEDDQVVVKSKKFSLNKAKSGGNPFAPSRPGGNRSGGGNRS